MAFFNFRKKKNNKKPSRIALRKTKSTGNIADENQILARQTTSTTAPVTDQLQLTKTNNSDKQQQSPAVVKVGSSTPNSIAEEDYVTGSSSSEDESSDDDNDSSTDSSDTDSVSSLPTASVLKNYSTQLQQQQDQQRPQHMIIPRVQLKTSSTPSTPKETERSSYFSSGDLELLLSMETQARIDAQEKAAAEAAAAPPPPPRKTALRFELPVTPSRSRSPNPAYSAYSRPRQRWSLPDEKWLDNDNKKKKNGKKSSSKKSKKVSKSWKNRIMGSDDDEGKNKSDSDDEEQERKLKVGDKVYLLHRPLPIFGYVRYMGTVNFESGDNWVGVELESRVGKNDGSVNGQRYFHTDPHRGTFVRKSELGFA
ncbi:CAP Gly-rich domain-containing protein [Circinella umbellata]|nr:CAP Gly-rich domain-containing protein [Circinella umbellata]